MTWSLYNRLGIHDDLQSGSRGWTAGHANDVLEVNPVNLLVGAETGGVWLLTSGIGLSLSLDWQQSNVHSLAHLEQSQHYFAGGSGGDPNVGSLYETDISQDVPLWSPWHEVALPQGIGGVNRIAISVAQHAILLATTTGLWWSRLPFEASDTYSWQQASGPVSGLDVQAVDIAADGTVLCSANNALFWGAFSTRTPDLLTHAATVTEPPAPNEFAFLCLACAPSRPMRAYAGASHFDPADGAGGRGTVTAVLRTDDGGRTWQRQAARTMAGFLTDHSQNGYTGAVAVHPTDPDTVCFGWTLGPWTSTDGGRTFTLYPGIHPDKHSYRYSSAGLLEASDGGVGRSLGEDLTSWDGSFNRGLANLQFYSTSGRYQVWGDFGISPTVPGLIGGGLQDNGDVYCVRFPNGSSTPWRVASSIGLTDGQTLTFPATTTDAVVSYGTNYRSTWNADQRSLDTAAAAIPIGQPHGGVTSNGAALLSGQQASVSHPDYRNHSGETLVAVAADWGDGSAPHMGDIYGLFATMPLDNPHWDYLGHIPLPSGSVISALASLDGHRVYAGARGTSIVWMLDTATGVTTPAAGFPAGSDWLSYIAAIAVAHDSDGNRELYAARSTRSSGAVYSSPDGVTWTQLTGPTDPGVEIVGLVADPTTSPATVYVAGVSSVWAIDVPTSTWTEVRDGLPRDPHCASLRLEARPSGEGFLHLSTYGWSTWFARIHDNPDAMVRDDVARWLSSQGHRDRASWVLSNLPPTFDPADFKNELDFLGVESRLGKARLGK
ncbi:hypothetical protein M6D93_01530 [Jatrophihabitans telluris]|uniref:Exo-alpha-sialidase n=1 Tax=Jatrophihabitans telluris TaxID=2038343 RepID=A0ABY4R0P7_9ACTN|nr:hypothetical protein [Jatrophihabitans telluris]UQX88696.1 hypothetical protein M6D93_01530 [Jatrophihabitans telluris]